MQDILIRAAKREELAEIVTLYNLMWVGSRNPIGTKIGENIFDSMQGKGQGMYVVDLDRRIVGAFMMLMQGDDDLKCVVDNVVVHPKYQRRGIGKTMMDFVAEKCHEAGCKQMVVSSGEKRHSAAEFFESLGFQRKGYGFVKFFD